MPRHVVSGPLAALLLSFLLALPAQAFDAFSIGAIRADGLNRLEEGTVLSYLPLVPGDQVNEQTARQAIRALYDSGLFQDVQLARDGNTLVVSVVERPQIISFTIDGNDKVGGDELMESLRKMGLAAGELFKRPLLDQVEQELRRQYYANGYYDVEITSTVTEEVNNRVIIKIDVVEGPVTKIASINLLGNTVFDTGTLLDQFKLEATNWKPFQRTNRYSKQQLMGDLESLQSYYQDRGYLRFNVDGIQVQLTPDKRSIYITVNIEEGEVYTIDDVRFSGETVLHELFLQAMTFTRAGQIFSRRAATESADRIEMALSDAGYAFAEVTPVPEVDEEARTVSLNYRIDPGKRVYVRRIVFSGNSSTNDETLRREMRQLEAAPFSKSAVERSRVRLERLAFMESVEVDTRPVPGSDDLVDVVFSMRERPPGAVQLGVGFSGAQGFLVTGSVTHANFLGTGNRVALTLDNNSYARQIDFSWTDPYFTEDGISQTINTFYRKSDRIIRHSSGFSSNVIGLNLTYGIPLSEYTFLRAGFGVSETSIETFANASSDEVLQFVQENGSRFTAYQLRTGLSRDTRNRTLFANRGSLYQLNADIVVPGSDLRYFSASFHTQNYIPIWRRFFIEFNSSLGYVDSYGKSSTVPPYENFFAGGSRTVRGYRDGTLGPRDTPFRSPYGGKLRTTAQTELIIPLPFAADGNSTRLSLFFDIGSVFAEPGDFEFNDLRQSAGVAFRWFTPFLGILNMSYAFPLNNEPGDETDRFQITFGTGF